MKTVSIPSATSSKARLRGVALASVIIALIAAFSSRTCPSFPLLGEKLRAKADVFILHGHYYCL
jgi:hypothetical protein